MTAWNFLLDKALAFESYWILENNRWSAYSSGKKFLYIIIGILSGVSLLVLGFFCVMHPPYDVFFDIACKITAGLMAIYYGLLFLARKRDQQRGQALSKTTLDKE